MGQGRKQVNRAVHSDIARKTVADRSTEIKTFGHRATQLRLSRQPTATARSIHRHCRGRILAATGGCVAVDRNLARYRN
jgi:hypothetical protein